MYPRQQDDNPGGRKNNRTSLYVYLSHPIVRKTIYACLIRMTMTFMAIMK